MKKTVFIAGVYAPGIGLSNVMNNLIRHLSESFRVICLGFDPAQQSDEVVESEIFGSLAYVYPLRGTIGLFRPDRKDLQSYIDQYKPVTIITLGPIISSRYLLALLQPHRSNLKVIAYVALEGKLVDMNYLKYARLTDCCVFYTKSVHDDFNRLLAEDSLASEMPNPIRSEHIAHGIDQKTFYPLPAPNDHERRKQAREIIYKDHPVDEHTFVVLNMNRPSHRKNIEATIAGFKLFAEGKKDVLLHLHIGTTETDTQKKYHRLVEEAGIQHMTVITPEPSVQRIKSVDWLNTLYNACDVGITTSKGEGWGLGLFEHAATKAAVIAPDHTSFSENWNNAAVMMPCAEKDFVFYAYCDMFMVAPSEVAKSLNLLYHDRNLLAEVTDACYQRSLAPKFDWKNVADQFGQLIEEVSTATEQVSSEMISK
jgi:D-inositol-3-phosphate glycosyltransferase